jgi:hypothetical protein
MAQGAMTIAVQANLSGNNGQRRRLAFWTIHGFTPKQKTQKQQINNLRRN